MPVSVLRIVTACTLTLTTGCSLVNPHVFQARFDETPRLAGPLNTEADRERARKVSERIRAEINAERQQLETQRNALAAQSESLHTERRRLDQALDEVRAGIEGLLAARRTLETQQGELEKRDAKAREIDVQLASAEAKESGLLQDLFKSNQQREQAGRDLASLEQAVRARAARRAALDALESAEQQEIAPVEAYAYSGEVKRRYREALGDQARLQSWLGLGLIPLSAAAIGLGATGADPSAILALGLTGATGFGVGQWLLNKPRQLAYVAGLKALTCAEDAVAPLAVPVTVRVDFRADRDALERALQDLQEQIGTVRLRADAADATAAEFTDSTDTVVKKSADGLRALVTSARTRIGEIASIVSSSEEALKSGAKLEQAFSQAGRALVVAVNRIADEVDGIIVETQRDLQALATIIGGLGGTYQTFTTVPSALKPQDKTRAGDFVPQGRRGEAPETAAQRQALRRLEQARADLMSTLIVLESRAAATSAATRKVADRVNAVVSDAPLERLKRDCGVKSEGIFTALTIDPAGPFQLEQGATVSFVIKGGLTPYGLSQVIPSGKGVEAVQDRVFGPGVTITASDKAEVRSYTLRVYDSAGPPHTKDVAIVVAAEKPAAPKQDPKLKALADTLPDKVVEVGGVKFTVKGTKLAGEKVEVELGFVSPKPANRKSEIIEQAVKAALVAGSDREPGVVTITNWKAIESALPPPAATATTVQPPPTAGPKPIEPLFDALEDSQRKRLQGSLCLRGADLDGVWGARTSEALKKFQVFKKENPTGRLTEALRDELLKMTEAARNARCDVGG